MSSSDCSARRQISSSSSASRRQVAQVLVDPVGHVGADDPLVPPGLAADRVHPGLRRVPVVDHVVVVEDHRAGHGGDQPADGRVAPRVPVQPRVLLEVGDLVGRAAVRSCRGARVDELARTRARSRPRRPGRRARAGGRASGRGPGGACAGPWRTGRRPRGRACCRPCAARTAARAERPRGTIRRRCAGRGRRPSGCGWRKGERSPRRCRARPCGRRARPRRGRWSRARGPRCRPARSGGRTTAKVRARRPRTSTSQGWSVSTHTVASCWPT